MYDLIFRTGQSHDGNCGIGFAACRPEQGNWPLGLMEGGEDLPGTGLRGAAHKTGTN